MLLLQDARTDQILFLSLFLLVGMSTRDWTLHPEMIAVAIATCVVTQWVMLAVSSQESEFDSKLHPTAKWKQATSFILHSSFLASVPSALVTSLGLSILVRADHYSTMVLACVAAIGSKFLIRINGKHIFNPGNFGIVAALTLTPDAWVSPGQWGEEGWYALLFLTCGGLVLRRVGRWDTTIAFLGSYAVLEAVRNVLLGWTWDVWAHRLMSGSLLMFSLFMITDPRTIPNARIGRLLWAMAIALLTFFLRNYLFISTAVFWSLFALAPLSILIDALLPADHFVWSTPLSNLAMEGAAAIGEPEMTALVTQNSKLKTQN